MKYVHARAGRIYEGVFYWIGLLNRFGPFSSHYLTDAGFREGDDVVILDAKEFYRLIDGLDRTAE